MLKRKLIIKTEREQKSYQHTFLSQYKFPKKNKTVLIIERFCHFGKD